MIDGKTIVGIIPARYASTRFPGKMLAHVAGQPLIQRVLGRVSSAKKLDRVLVATDDERIRDVVLGLGHEAVMTRPDHPSGTDRVAEALDATGGDIVVNIQGDEPMVDPALIDDVAAALAVDASWQMATAAAPIDDPDVLGSVNVVKVVCDQSGRALYFSRSVIPHDRDRRYDWTGGGPPGVYRRHIGLYGYQAGALRDLVAAPPCATEELERLEQLRALHLGFRIKVIETRAAALGIDVPEDVPVVEAEIARMDRRHSTT